MTDPPDDLDTNLHERFGRDYAQPRAEPFLSQTTRRIAAVRRRAILLRFAAQGVALATLIFASSWLIKTSTLLSMQLESSLGTVTQWLFTPVGAAAAFIIGTGGVALARVKKMKWRN